MPTRLQSAPHMLLLFISSQFRLLLVRPASFPQTSRYYSCHSLVVNVILPTRDSDGDFSTDDIYFIPMLGVHKTTKNIQLAVYLRYITRFALSRYASKKPSIHLPAFIVLLERKRSREIKCLQNNSKKNITRSMNQLIRTNSWTKKRNFL